MFCSVTISRLITRNKFPDTTSTTTTDIINYIIIIILLFFFIIIIIIYYYYYFYIIYHDDVYYYYDEEDENIATLCSIEFLLPAKAGEKLSLQTYRCFTFFYLVAPMEPEALEERADVTRQKLLNYIN